TIDTDKANDSTSSSMTVGQESYIASASLGGNVTISAVSAINLGSIVTDSDCPATNNCTGTLTISRIDPNLTSSMQVKQVSGELIINGRTTINVGSAADVNFSTVSNKFTGGFVLPSAGDVSITDAEGDIMLNGV